MMLSMQAKVWLCAVGVALAAAGTVFTGAALSRLPFLNLSSTAGPGRPGPITRTVARVCVVGSGLAGTAAALAAAEAGVEVLVLEKEPRLGGNSMKASSGINALSPAQGDTAEAFMEDTLKSGGGLSVPTLVGALVLDSQDAVRWLEGHGIDLSGWVQLGGHTKKRTHTSTRGPVGVSIMKALLAKEKSQPNIQVVTGANVASLLVGPRGQGVQGVEYTAADGTTHKVEASAVVLASGGFGANTDLLKAMAPQTTGLPTTNGPWATGDGLTLAARASAALVHLQQVQVHPTGFVDPADPVAGTKFLAPEKLRGVGGILVNADARRFVDELATRDVVAAAVSRQTEREAWLVLGAAAAEAFGMPSMNFYLGRGLFREYAGVEAVEAATGLPAVSLTLQMAEYNHDAAVGKDDFNKTVFPTVFDPTTRGTLYVARVTPVVHYTMGGVAIDSSGQALDTAFKPIPGLYAAGEVSGGVHGANRLGGNSLLECTVFGRRAGQAAATFTQAATADGGIAVA